MYIVHIGGVSITVFGIKALNELLESRGIKVTEPIETPAIKGVPVWPGPPAEPKIDYGPMRFDNPEIKSHA